jgi:hypothetical protein
MRNIDALNIPQFKWMRKCQENAGNSADECLPCARIAISANFSNGAFCRIAFPRRPQ